jgi:hypothetical protein
LAIRIFLNMRPRLAAAEEAPASRLLQMARLADVEELPPTSPARRNDRRIHGARKGALWRVCDHDR